MDAGSVQERLLPLIGEDRFAIAISVDETKAEELRWIVAWPNPHAVRFSMGEPAEGVDIRVIQGFS